MVNIKERPGSNKRQTPSKKHHTKSSIGNKKKTRNNVIDLSNSYIPTHKSTKSNGIVTSDNINPYLKPKSSKVKNFGENKHPKDKFMQIYKERSYEALFRNGNQQKVDISSMQSMLAQNKKPSTFLSNKINKISFMN